MIGLDTNVLARYYIADKADAEAARQHEAARRLVESGQPLMACKTVLLELESVMRCYYGFAPQEVAHKGATEHDPVLMRASVSPKVQVKAAGGVRDLDGLIKVRDLGGSRFGATATAAMLDEYRRREAAQQAGHSTESSSPLLGGGGY